MVDRHTQHNSSTAPNSFGPRAHQPASMSSTPTAAQRYSAANIIHFSANPSRNVPKTNTQTRTKHSFAFILSSYRKRHPKKITQQPQRPHRRRRKRSQPYLIELVRTKRTKQQQEGLVCGVHHPPAPHLLEQPSRCQLPHTLRNDALGCLHREHVSRDVDRDFECREGFNPTAQQCKRLITTHVAVRGTSAASHTAATADSWPQCYCQRNHLPDMGVRFHTGTTRHLSF